MGRRAGLVACLLGGLIATVLFVPAAGAAPPPAGGSTPTGVPSGPSGPGTITATGTADGKLTAGSTIAVKILVHDSLSWQRIGTIEVSLKLTGAPLETIQFVPTAFSVAIVNSEAPVSIGSPGILKGQYFRLDNSKVSPSASNDDNGGQFTLRFPLRLALDPPTGAQLVLTATDVSTASSGDVPLSPPVKKQDQGFPWGTIGLAVAAALFLGGFIGNLFSTRRVKSRPNVYATVARRIEQDRTRR